MRHLTLIFALLLTASVGAKRGDKCSNLKADIYLRCQGNLDTSCFHLDVCLKFRKLYFGVIPNKQICTQQLSNNLYIKEYKKNGGYPCKYKWTDNVPGEGGKCVPNGFWSYHCPGQRYPSFGEIDYQCQSQRSDVYRDLGSCEKLLTAYNKAKCRQQIKKKPKDCPELINDMNFSPDTSPVTADGTTSTEGSLSERRAIRRFKETVLKPALGIPPAVPARTIFMIGR
ncbi:MAG: hypothetical protein ISR65_00375 [Bacteriovoracaceae bacterium]|nr:hypothetical protein [Bacteriovoracaceae bacterium]